MNNSLMRLNRSQTKAQKNLKQILDLDIFLVSSKHQFEVALTVAKIPLVNNENNNKFIKLFLKTLLYSEQPTIQIEINIFYLYNILLFNNLWWLESSDDRLPFNQSLLDKNKREFLKLTELKDYNIYNLMVLIPQMMKKQELIIKQSNSKLLYNNVLNVIKNDIYNPCVYIELAHKPPFGLIPHRLMREDNLVI